MKATARPSPSAITQALVPYPPRDRPSASQRSRCAEEPPFERHRLLSGGPGCWCGVPESRGALSRDEEDALWQEFYTAAPAQRREFEPSSKRRKKRPASLLPATG